MKTLKDLLLGDPRLYEVCVPVEETELPLVSGWLRDMDSVLKLLASLKFLSIRQAKTDRQTITDF